MNSKVNSPAVSVGIRAAYKPFEDSRRVPGVVTGEPWYWPPENFNNYVILGGGVKPELRYLVESWIIWSDIVGDPAMMQFNVAVEMRV